MRWATVAMAVGVALAVAAVMAVNVLLLGYGIDRNDPVGRLSPVSGGLAPATSPPAAVTTVDDDHAGRGSGADD
jgi:hypothetical protein